MTSGNAHRDQNIARDSGRPPTLRFPEKRMDDARADSHRKGDPMGVDLTLTRGLTTSVFEAEGRRFESCRAYQHFLYTR